MHRLPVPEDLRESIEWRFSLVTPESRLRGRVPLFPNPTARNREGRWIANTLREEWNAAASSVGVRVWMYEGTKHAFASDALARGGRIHNIRDFLGHTDARSAERYAKLADVGRLDVPRRPPDLSPGCRSPEKGGETLLNPAICGGTDGTRTRSQSSQLTDFTHFSFSEIVCPVCVPVCPGPWSTSAGRSPSEPRDDGTHRSSPFTRSPIHEKMTPSHKSMDPQPPKNESPRQRKTLVSVERQYETDVATGQMATRMFVI